jgi:NAD(P)-dependent dehydrogenase (short-subunit alcohol dehydrogenase family)
MKDLSGRVVVVTGAASGIGRETALAFGRRGADLVVCDIDTQGLADVAAELSSRGCEVFAERVDVSDPSQVEALCELAFRTAGRVDVLVNNAGVGVAGMLEDMSIADWEWIVGINFWGVIFGCRSFYPRMAAQGGGHIVNISSGAALAPLPTMTAYCSTKYAVLGFSEAFRAEAALNNVGVTAVCPGIVATNITRTTRMRSCTRRSAPEELLGRIDRFYRRRSYHPSKVAEAVVRAVEKDRGVVAVGPETKVMDWVHRASRVLWAWNIKASLRFLLRWL